MTVDELKALIRPCRTSSPGIQFRDITTLLAHGQGLAATMRHLGEAARLAEQMIAGMEARGFIFGAGVAVELVLVSSIRKPGNCRQHDRCRLRSRIRHRPAGD